MSHFATDGPAHMSFRLQGLERRTSLGQCCMVASLLKRNVTPQGMSVNKQVSYCLHTGRIGHAACQQCIWP